MPTTQPDFILIVDDDADICETLETLLTLEGVAVRTAGDGLKALQVLRAAARPALILLDIRMPRMNGLEFRAAQLADPALAALPVVGLTGDHRLVQEAAKLGFECLEKPIGLQALRALCDRYGLVRRPVEPPA
ncbi:MAG TPA: response regulator [Polyangia bacterium]|jgi:CheY-like chemotaxis protein